MWSSVEAIAFRGKFPSAPGRGRSQLSRADLARYSAFVRQAQQYYATLSQLDPTAKPLTGYYFALNMTKAYLTIRASLPIGKIHHGASDAYERKQRCRFTQEYAKVSQQGIFRLLAESTGSGYCYGSGTVLQVSELLPHLVDAYDLYADNTGNLPRLVQIANADVLFDRTKAWIKVEVRKEDLHRRGDIGPESLLKRAGSFGVEFRLVQDGNDETASYESHNVVEFGGGRTYALPGLIELFDSSLIASRRGWQGGQRFIELSRHANILSQEALIFLVLHHLSNMVRYRPEEVDKLRQSQYYWLFSSWVDRACENYLLAMASRITFEEHVIL